MNGTAMDPMPEPLWFHFRWERDNRYYELRVQQDWFGDWLLTRVWGQKGSALGQLRHDLCVDQTAEAVRREKRGYLPVKGLYAQTSENSVSPNPACFNSFPWDSRVPAAPGAWRMGIGRSTVYKLLNETSTSATQQSARSAQGGYSDLPHCYLISGIRNNSRGTQ